MTKILGTLLALLAWAAVASADVIDVANIHTARDWAANACTRATQTVDGMTFPVLTCANQKGFSVPLLYTPNAGSGDTAWSLTLYAKNPINATAGTKTTCWQVKLACADVGAEFETKTYGTATQLTLENLASATTFNVAGTVGTGFNAASGTRDSGNQCSLWIYRDDALGGGCDGDDGGADSVNVTGLRITN